MCLQDWAMHRYSNRALKKVTLTNGAATQLVGQHPGRVALIIPSITTDDVWIGLDNSVAVDNGFRIAAGLAPVHFTLQHHGMFVASELWAITSVGSRTISVIEVYLNLPWDTLIAEWKKLMGV